MKAFVALVAALGLLWASVPSAAQGQKTVPVPDGAKVTVQGTTARISGGGAGGNNGGGAFSCTCQGGKGKCVVMKTMDSISCAKATGADRCSSSCDLAPTTAANSAAPQGASTPAPPAKGATGSPARGK
jgi:hypothetical protein